MQDMLPHKTFRCRRGRGRITGRPVVCLALLVFLAFAERPAIAQDCLVFGRISSYSGSLFEIVQSNVDRVFSDAGICIRSRTLLAARATEALIRGQIDGEYLRVVEYEKRVGEAAIAVGEPLYQGKGWLLTNNGAVNSAEDISAARLGVLRGLVWQDRFKARAASVVEANSHKQLVDMFLNGRVDTIMIDNYNFERFPALASTRRFLAMIFDTRVFLHKSKAPLAPRFASVIRDFKQRGCRFDLAEGGPGCLPGT